MSAPELSATQWLMIRVLSRAINNGYVQVAGNGSAPRLSACRALVRRDFARTYRTGHYGLTDKGRELVDEAMKRKPINNEVGDV